MHPPFTPRIGATPPPADPPLVVLVPSRGRPHNAARLLEAWDRTTTGFAAVMFGVDDDDETLGEYREVVPADQLRVGERRGLCATTNEMASEWAPRCKYLGSIGDDHLPRTNGWDRIVCHTLAGLPHGIVYTNDTLQGENLATACFMSSEIVLALGYMAPPALQHLYIDNSWMELGRALGTLRYLPHVVIEHLHPVGGVTAWDKTYEEGTSDAVWDHDEAAFNEWKANGLTEAVARVAGQ